MSGVRPRPLLRYHGGKWKLASWIISHFPEHRVFVEPFGGGGSVLLRKTRSYGEVYNDLSRELVNLFTVARDRGDELARALELTPFSRIEFHLSYESSDDELEQARRTVVRCFQGFGSDSFGSVSGFRANCNRAGTTPAQDWAGFPSALMRTIERLQGVVIECKDALDCMSAHDTPETLHYVDPPYVHRTRTKKKVYEYEMDDRQHVELIEFLKTLKGDVVLSGYSNDIYADHLSDWNMYHKDSFADGARPRTECIWTNFESSYPKITSWFDLPDRTEEATS
jgi:DNA adenine methylase